MLTCKLSSLLIKHALASFTLICECQDSILRNSSIGAVERIQCLHVIDAFTAFSPFFMYYEMIHNALGVKTAEKTKNVAAISNILFFKFFLSVGEIG